VPIYVLERYLAGLNLDELRARVAEGAGLGGDGGVRYLRSIYLCDDELCFSLFESPSERVLRDAARRADMAFERIAHAIDLSVDDLELAPSGREPSLNISSDGSARQFDGVALHEGGDHG